MEPVVPFCRRAPARWAAQAPAVITGSAQPETHYACSGDVNPAPLDWGWTPPGQSKHQSLPRYKPEARRCAGAGDEKQPLRSVKGVEDALRMPRWSVLVGLPVNQQNRRLDAGCRPDRADLVDPEMRLLLSQSECSFYVALACKEWRSFDRCCPEVAEGRHSDNGGDAPALGGGLQRNGCA